MKIDLSYVYARAKNRFSQLIKRIFFTQKQPEKEDTEELLARALESYLKEKKKFSIQNSISKGGSS